MLVENILVPDSKIAIVYPMPSIETEARKKESGDDIHFQSKSENGFLHKLSGAGIELEDCSILSIIRDRCPSIARMDREELELWQELLYRDLKKISPNIIIAVDELSLCTLMGKPLQIGRKGEIVATLSERLNGYVVPTSFGKVLSVSGISNSDWAIPSWHPMMGWNLAKAKRNSLTKDSRAKDFTLHVTNNMELLKEIFLEPSYQSNPSSLLSFDIECAGMEITCISFARDIHSAYVVPLHHLHPSELAYCLRNIGLILDSPVGKVGQNLNFDIFYLGYYYNMPVRNFKFDTMIAMHSLYANLPKDLNTLGAIFTDEPSWKDDKGWKSED
jgi:hypothetical protein